MAELNENQHFYSYIFYSIWKDLGRLFLEFQGVRTGGLSLYMFVVIMEALVVASPKQFKGFHQWL